MQPLPPSPPPPPVRHVWTEPPRPDDRPGSSLMAVGYGVALLPIAVAVLLLVAAPGFLQPLLDDRIAVVGVPAGVLALLAIAILSFLGVVVVRLARSWLAIVLVLLCFTAPALTILVFSPAIVLIAINLGS